MGVATTNLWAVGKHHHHMRLHFWPGTEMDVAIILIVEAAAGQDTVSCRLHKGYHCTLLAMDKNTSLFNVLD